MNHHGATVRMQRWEDAAYAEENLISSQIRHQIGRINEQMIGVRRWGGKAVGVRGSGQRRRRVNPG